MATAVLSHPVGHVASPWPRSHSNQYLKLRCGGLRTSGLRDGLPKAQWKAVGAKANWKTCAFHSLPEDQIRLQIGTVIESEQYKRPAGHFMTWSCSDVANFSPEVRIRPAGSSYTTVATSASESRPLATHAAAPTSHASGRGQKRQHDQSGGGDGDDKSDDMRPRPGRRRRRGEDERGRLLFACPFLKKDPVRWRPCYKHELRRIRDVKQHLRRAHSVTPYCPVCGEGFADDPTEDRLKRHLRLRECQPKAFDPPQGITGQQREQLGRRVPATLPEAEQWYTVFDIVFPGHPRPSTPYVDPDMSEDLSSYFEFSAAQGSRIVKQSILHHTSNIPYPVDGDTFESLVRQGLDDLRNEWFSGRSALVRSSSRSSIPLSPRPEAEHISTMTTTSTEYEEDLSVMDKLRPFLSGAGGPTQDSDLGDRDSPTLVSYKHFP